MTKPTALLCVASLCAAACATNSADIKAARAATYQTEYANVWNAVEQTIRKRYHKIKVADAAQGVLITEWTYVEKDLESQNANEADYGGNAAGTLSQQAHLFQLRVKIEPGGPPWRITIDGEAALYRPGSSQLDPWKHGEPGEPHWVQGKIDAAYVEIHEALKPWATAPAPAKTP